MAEKLMLGIGSIEAKMPLDCDSRQMLLRREALIDLDTILEL